MPIELFRVVLTHLALISIMALQFVSHAIHEKTKKVDDTDLVDVKAWLQNIDGDGEELIFRIEYMQLLISIDAATPPHQPLSRLTCHGCLKRKDNSINDADDSHFDRHKRDASCILSQQARLSRH